MAKKTINNVDDVKRVYEDESLLREMYNDDVERVKNGEKAIFFGHLNDKPLENVYPEYEILGPSYLKLLRGLKAPSVYKVDPSSLGITGGDIANGAFDVARSILNLPRTIGNIFIRTGKGVGNILGDGPASKIWKASIGKWMTYFGRYPERMPAFIDASNGMNGEDDMTSFSDAFSDADKKGLDEFEWKGKKYKVEKKKEGGETKPSRRRIDWDRFKEAYGNMKRKGAGHARKIDTEGLDYLYDALYRNNFTERQIEAIIGNVIEESGGDPFAKAKGSQYKGLFQESNIRYPVSEFEADKKRFEGKKKEYIDYMVDRFNKHVRDAKYYSVKGTKYKKAQEAVDEFFSTEAGIDYSYPLVYAFEAPGDKEGTYSNRKSVSDIISKSYADDGLYEPDVTANKVEPKQDANNNGFGDAFKEAKRKGLNEFVFNGKRYSTAVKEDGGPVLDDVIYMKDRGDISDGSRRGYTDEYIASRDNTSIGNTGINENILYNKTPSNSLDITEMVLGGVPVIGDVMDAKDMYESAINKDALGMVLAAVGLIPFIGGVSKKALQAKRAIKGLSKKDNELLKKIPDYASPASPIGESWNNHKKRLFSGAFKRLTGMDLPSIKGEPDPSLLDTKVYNWDDPELFEHIKSYIGDEYSDKEIRGIIDDVYMYGELFGKIVKSKDADKISEEFIKSNKGITNKDIEDFIKSHEAEHAVHYPDKGAEKEGFDINKLKTKKAKEYFRQGHFSEIAARGTQIKNYFGLTDDSQVVTPEMLEYAKRNYIKDYGIDNDMSDFFKTIVDYDKAAKWITEHASVGLGAYYVGDKIGNPKKEKKRDGGLTLYKAGFRFVDNKPEYGDVKDIRYRIPSKKFMYYYNDRNEGKKECGGIVSDLFVFEDGGDIKQKQKKAYDYFTMKRGMSQIQALAIIGNLMAESGLKDDISGDNGTSYGIQQWHNERKDALFKKARKNGHDTPTFEDQLEFLADEYEGKTGYSNFLYARKGKMGPGYYNYSRSDFQDAENLRDAVVAWNQGAGRPHKSVIRNDDRYSAALKVAKNLGFDFGLDAGAAPMYGQMGVGEDFIFHEEGEEPTGDTQPVSGAQAASPQDTAPTTQEDMMKNWIEAYGKGIVAQLMATSGNNKVNTSVDDTTERYRDYVMESKDDEDSKRMALLQSFLPNIQLKVKGVTQVRGNQ